MFKTIKKSEIFLIIIMIAIIALIAHFTLIARNQFLRFIYPVEAQLSKYSVSCSDQSPTWMKQALIETTLKHGSLSNQLVYISPHGKSYHCENGWVGTPIISKYVDVNTRYRYASMTKPVTASLVLDLVSEKKLKLDDTLVSYLPELKIFKDERIKNITIENLLTHTSGFDRLKSNDPLFNTYEKPWCPYNLDKLKNIKLDHSPGQAYHYDNRNYCLLSLVLEKVERKPFRQILRDYIPIHNHNIQFIDGPFGGDEVTYDFRYEPVFTKSYIGMFDFQALSPVAGLSGSAIAYAGLLRKNIQRNSAIFHTSSLGVQCKMTVLKSCFTLGLSQYQQSKHDLIVKWHDGGLPGSNSLFIYDDKGGVTVWTGNGSPPENTEEYAQFKMLYSYLRLFYLYV